MLNTQNVGYGYGYVVSEDLPNYIRGRLFTLIEALGLKETQEKDQRKLAKYKELGFDTLVIKGSELKNNKKGIENVLRSI